MCAGPGHARQAEAGERGLGSEIRRDCCCCLRAGAVDAKSRARQPLQTTLETSRFCWAFSAKAATAVDGCPAPWTNFLSCRVGDMDPLSLWTCKLKNDWLPARHGNQGYVPTVS